MKTRIQECLCLEPRWELERAVGEGVTEKAGGLLPDGVIHLWIYVLLGFFPSCSYHCLHLLLLIVLCPTFTPSKRQMWKKRDFGCFLFSPVFTFKDYPIYYVPSIIQDIFISQSLMHLCTFKPSFPSFKVNTIFFT